MKRSAEQSEVIRNAREELSRLLDEDLEPETRRPGRRRERQAHTIELGA